MQLIKNATFLNLEKHNKFTTILHNKLLQVTNDNKNSSLKILIFFNLRKHLHIKNIINNKKESFL